MSKYEFMVRCFCGHEFAVPNLQMTYYPNNELHCPACEYFNLGGVARQRYLDVHNAVLQEKKARKKK